jgi:Co/Zn/Cd efflux system component
MSDHCCQPRQDLFADARVRASYARALWVALVVNLGMFLIEVVAGLAAGSASLEADAVDFLGDAGNYAISLLVVGMALRYRAAAALIKGVSMATLSLAVLATIVWHLARGTVPEAMTMSAVGVAALAANAVVFALLWAYRAGDANMRSVWICTRNDVLGNLAVLLAALGVFGTGSGWPDLSVALIMTMLALQGAWVIVGRARVELRSARPPFTAAP